MTDDKRAFELHDLALSAVRAMGTPASDEGALVMECKLGQIVIRYWPKQRWLDVICNGRVLTVEQWGRCPTNSAVHPRRLGNQIGQGSKYRRLISQQMKRNQRSGRR